MPSGVREIFEFEVVDDITLPSNLRSSTFISVTTELAPIARASILPPSISALFISPVFITGEVRRPGYYKFNITSYLLDTREKLPTSLSPAGRRSSLERDVPSRDTISTGFPRIFDVIQRSNGLTPYANLSNIKVIRHN